MTETEQRIAIAEACGPRMFVLHKPSHDPFGYYRKNACGYTGNIQEAWRVTAEEAAKHTTGKHYEHEPDRVIAEPFPPLDYPNDLNAMNNACKCLTINQRVMFYGHLYAITQRQFEGESDEDSYSFALVNATASQRAEAFLRAIGKWKD